MTKEKHGVLKNIFTLVYIITTVTGLLIGYYIFRDVKHDLYKDLTHTSSVIRSYYELSFKQWELSLLSVGLGINDIVGEDKKARQLEFANNALARYELLLAFGYADTTGKVQIFTGMDVNDSLPHLAKSEASLRSFELVKKGNGLVIGEAYYFSPVDDWILPIRVPIRDRENKLVGINTSAINYRAMTQELATFSLDPDYQIHLINDHFGTTQLYYPMDTSKYKSILRQSSDIYKNEITELQLGKTTYFTAINSIDKKEIIGVKTELKNLEHSLIVSVNEDVLWSSFLGSGAKLVFYSYLVLCLIFYLLYRHFKARQLAFLSALDTERANLKAIFESSTNIIGLWDDKYNLIEFNSAFENYSALDGIKLFQGIDVFSQMQNKEIVALFKSFQDRALKGENIKEVVEYPLEQGSLFFVFSYSPIFKNGKISGVSMFVDDITELKNSQKKLEEYNEKLEEKVRTRTEEIHVKNKDLEMAVQSLKETQGQLIQIEKMASLGILAAGIGHEINNPLNFIKNGINTMVDVLESTYPNIDEEIEPFVKIVNEGVDRASNIVKSLSHFSRTGVSMDEECDIHEILDNCLTILQSQFKLRIEVIKAYTDSSCLIKGNDGRLHQAFLNILTNAGQAIVGNGTISIITECNGKRFRVTIKDTGSGISKENIKRISDPFFTTKPPGQGTGLGMFITQSIIQEHNGTIEVESELGKGTEFIITFNFQL